MALEHQKCGYHELDFGFYLILINLNLNVNGPSGLWPLLGQCMVELWDSVVSDGMLNGSGERHSQKEALYLPVHSSSHHPEFSPAPLLRGPRVGSLPLGRTYPCYLILPGAKLHVEAVCPGSPTWHRDCWALLFGFLRKLLRQRRSSWVHLCL